MGIDTLAISKFQNNQTLTAACWADDAGMALNINSYAWLQQANIAQAQTSLLYFLELWICKVEWAFTQRPFQSSTNNSSMSGG